MKESELPSECQKCLNLKCGYVRMDGNNDYTCRKIVLFLENKEAPCLHKEDR